MKSFECSLDALESFARWFWSEAPEAAVYLFSGPMGAGKTTLIGALCRAKGVEDAVSSPTFSLVNEYHYREGGAKKVIFHMDLYRLRSEEEAVGAGIEDSLYSGATCLVEWPERAPGLFDEKAVHLCIEAVDAERRQVKILDSPSLNPVEQS